MGEGKQSLDWAREMMERADVSPRDVARSWDVAEVYVLRWLAGLTVTDIPAVRVARFSRLVKRPVGEIMTHLGYDHG